MAVFRADRSKRFLVLGMWVICVGFAGLVGAEPVTPSGSYDAKGKRDPFVSLVRDGRLIVPGSDNTVSTTDCSTPSLAGIVWDPSGQSLALVNETEVKVGETVCGCQVTEIRSDAVVLACDDDPEPVVLTISYEDAPKQQPNESRGGEGP